MLEVNINPLGRYTEELQSLFQTAFPNLNEARQAALLGNINSIALKTQRGQTETLYYPASGLDILRPLIAYNTTRLILIDSMNNYHQTVKSVLSKTGIQYDESTEGNKLTLTFNFLGKNRTIEVIEGDARKYSLSDFNLPSVDVLHIFLPTGADQPLEADGQEYPAIKSFLTWDSYQLVTEEGFFIFQEHPLSDDEVTEDLLKHFGLEPLGIKRRPPSSITTGIQQNSDDDPSSQEGVIYKKVSEISEDAFNMLNSAIDLSFEFTWNAWEISKKQFKCNVMEMQNVPKGDEIVHEISSQLEQYCSELEDLKGHLQSNGCSPEVAYTFIEGYKDSALKRVTEAQGEIRSWIEQYNELKEEQSHTVDQIKERFEITEYQETCYSSKYPLIAKLLELSKYCVNDLQDTIAAVQTFLDHSFTAANP